VCVSGAVRGLLTNGGKGKPAMSGSDREFCY
jgi:hypothetical protein